MTLKFQKSFSCGHFYSQPAWSDEKNKQEFGLCFNPHGHGHDYRLEVEVQGEEALKAQAMLEELVQRLDHQHLNFAIPEFQSKIPTTENLALYLRKEFQALIGSAQIEILSLKLNETQEIWIEL